MNVFPLSLRAKGVSLLEFLLPFVFFLLPPLAEWQCGIPGFFTFSLPEFMNFKLLGKTILVDFFWAIHSASAKVCHHIFVNKAAAQPAIKRSRSFRRGVRLCGFFGSFSGKFIGADQTAGFPEGASIPREIGEPLKTVLAPLADLPSSRGTLVQGTFICLIFASCF